MTEPTTIDENTPPEDFVNVVSEDPTVEVADNQTPVPDISEEEL